MSLPDQFQQLSQVLGRKGSSYYRSLLIQFLTCDSVFEADVMRESLHEYLAQLESTKKSGVVALHNQLMKSLVAPPSTDEEEAVFSGRQASDLDADGGGHETNQDSRGRTAKRRQRREYCETQCLGHISTMPLSVFTASLLTRHGVITMVANADAKNISCACDDGALVNAEVLNAAKQCIKHKLKQLSSSQSQRS